jgi:hypothetical protein
VKKLLILLIISLVIAFIYPKKSDNKKCLGYERVQTNTFVNDYGIAIPDEFEFKCFGIPY